MVQQVFFTFPTLPFCLRKSLGARRAVAEQRWAVCARVEGRSSVPRSTVLSLLPPHLLIPAQNGFQALCLEEREDDCVSFKVIIVMNTVIGKPVIS